jgi:hypothetical protein
MGILGAVEHAAHVSPAVAPVVFATLVALTAWAYRRRRFGLCGSAALLAITAILLYTAGEANDAQARVPTQGGLHPPRAAPGGGPLPGVTPELSQFSSTGHLHPRFPSDFTLPTDFIHEHSSGGLRQGAITVRFRFHGEPQDAVRDLQDAERSAGWDVEVLAPHRMVFRKEGRTVEAWFSFPGHSLVLDIPDPR